LIPYTPGNRAACGLKAEITRGRERHGVRVHIAEYRGWAVVEQFTDAGISGARGREKRQRFDNLLKAVVHCKIDIVAARHVPA
jgi:hypothetical protein